MAPRSAPTPAADLPTGGKQRAAARRHTLSKSDQTALHQPPANAPDADDPAKELPHPSRDEIRIEAVLQALADPVRLRIVREIAAAEVPPACGTIELPVSTSTRTHHFRTLREAGVIRMRRRGTARISTLRREDLDALYPGLLTSILAAPH